MSRHSDDGPPGGAPGGTPGQPTPTPPLPDPAGGPTPPWTAPPVEPAPSLPRWARRDEDPGTPDLDPAASGPEGAETPNIVPSQDLPARQLPDLTTPPAEGPGRATAAGRESDLARAAEPADAPGPGAARLRGFRRRALPPLDPHRQAPAIEAVTGGPSPDPSESRTIVPGHTAPPGQLGPGIRGQLGPGPTPVPTGSLGPPGLPATGPSGPADPTGTTGPLSATGPGGSDPHDPAGSPGPWSPASPLGPSGAAGPGRSGDPFGSAGPGAPTSTPATTGPLGAAGPGGGSDPFGTPGPGGTAAAAGPFGASGGTVDPPGRQAPAPRAQAGQDPPGAGTGGADAPGTPPARGFQLPPELPLPPQRPRGSIPASAATEGAPPAPRTASGAPRPGQMAAAPRRLTPEQIRTNRFGRSPLGRRGYNEDEVDQFTHRLAEELASRDAEVVRLIDENHRLKHAMRTWQSERIDQPEVEVAERVNAETAELMARAQQQIDAQLAQTELYCRQREQEAVRRYDEIVRHARLQVKREAEQVAHRYRATSGAGYNPDQETLQRQQVYIGALLQALDALGAHVQATRQAFASEIGNLTATAEPEPEAEADDPSAAPDPLTQRVD